MTILIDFGAVKTGGGVQLAMNFLDSLERDTSRHDRVSLLLPSTGPLASRRLEGEYRCVLTSPRRQILRCAFESTLLWRHIRRFNIKGVYTFFGSGLVHPRNVASIVTVAYPIICYPDSPYWMHAPPLERTKKQLVNALRRHRLRHADHIFVETEVMRDRLASCLPQEASRFEIIPPAPSDYVTRRQLEPSESGEFRFAFLSGLDQHKNLWRLCQLARSLRQITSQRFKFIVSVRRSDFESRVKRFLVDRLTLDTNFEFTGPIHPTKINDLYHNADCLVNLSDLESFSNNYLESWKAGLPIIASDRDFARHICADSAVYVEPHVPEKAALGLATVMNDTGIRERLVLSGQARLATIRTPDERYELLWKRIESLVP